MRVLLLAIVQAAVDLLGHHAEHIGEASTLGEVDLAAGADIFFRFVDIAVAHDKHLRKIQLRTTLTQHLILERRHT